MSSALTQPELFALLSAGQTLVLPQAHAARILHGRFLAHARETGATISDTGSASAWQEWTRSLWSSLLLEGHDDRLLLNHLQEERLWADIIAAHPSSRNLHAPEDLAAMARSALRLAAAYNTVDRLRSAADTVDTRSFAAWLDTFRDHCQSKRLLSSALLDQALARHLRAGTLHVAAPVHLVGFDEQTPSQRDLVTALQTRGTAVHAYPLAHTAPARGSAPAVTAPNPADELRLAVRLIADQARSTPHPSTFCLVLPRPEDRRPELERLFREVLAPELEPITADLSSTPWHFAAQAPLSASTAIAHALQLLRWVHEPLSTDRIGELLLSPYLHFTEPLEIRARFEAQTLRDGRLLRPELTLAAFLQLTAQPARARARFPELHNLGRHIEREKLHGQPRSHADWADAIRTLLRTAGWPGDRPLNPSEFAATEAWESLLDLLSTLTATSKRLSFSAFLKQLAREADHTPSPGPASTAPLQVLTLKETEGIAFDHTLILSATDTNLPEAERLNALLPRHLQMQFQMPGADPGRTYLRTLVHLEQLLDRSGTLHLFAPRADETGPLRFTPLAEELGCTSVSADDLLPPLPASQLIQFAEAPDTAALPPLPSVRIAGGARVLELQAACGFRAFATFRLGAGEVPNATLGLDAREGGSRLHKALELLWQDLGSQARLRAMPSADREVAVESAVRSALAPLQPAAGAQNPWTHSFLDILQRRFTRLLLRWLDCELERSPFTPLAQEQERTITIGPLELSLRPDRIDQVEGGEVFVDYKTTYTLSTDHWLGPRPDAPQLPLYALLAKPEDLRGLAFARVRWDKDMGWISLSDHDRLFPQDKRNTQHELAAELENWRTELASLAQAFADGQTDVAPKTYPETCKYCAHRLLCRLDPTELLAQDTDEEELAEDELNG